jgi:hypothetical protein
MTVHELHDAVAASHAKIESLQDELYEEKQRKNRLQCALTAAAAQARRGRC